MASLTSGCTPAHPWTVALPQPALRPASDIHAITSYERAAVTIAAVFERDLGFAPFPVTLHFHPGRAAFEAALLQSGYEPVLARDTARTMGAIGGHRHVLLNESMLLPLSWPARVGVLAHELTHSLQYEWGGGVRGASDQWLREGFAEWVAARILERLGATTLERVLGQKREEVRTLGRSRMPRLDAMATFPEWIEVNGRFEGAPYAYAFLAVDFLIDRHGTAAAVRYFELFARSDDRRGNFRAAFGEELSAFEETLYAHVLAGVQPRNFNAESAEGRGRRGEDAVLRDGRRAAPAIPALGKLCVDPSVAPVPPRRYTCTNCRWMEANMFPRPDVRVELERFVRVKLYTDGDGEKYEKHQKLQADTFGTVALPYYAVMSSDGRPLATFPGLTRNPEEFLAFLRGPLGNTD